MKTNDKEKQRKYEDKISLRSLLLRDIDRVNKALLDKKESGIEELENLLSDLPEDIYYSVLPRMNKRTEKLNEKMKELNEWYNEYVKGAHPKYKRDRKRKYLRKVLRAKRGYVREVKKIIRWTMDEFGLGLEEEGKRIDEGGLSGS